MSEQIKNPFDLLIDEIRAAIREEIKAAGVGSVNPSPSSLLSAEDAAKLFNVPLSWIREAARRGELQSVKVGHYVRFELEDLEAFIKANRSS